MKAKFVLLAILYATYCFGINPKKDYLSTPKEYGMGYQEKTVKTDSIEICIWISQPKINIAHKKKIKTIVLAYGDYGNMSYYLPYIDFY